MSDLFFFESVFKVRNDVSFKGFPHLEDCNSAGLVMKQRKTVFRIATPLNLPRTFSRGLLTLEGVKTFSLGVIEALRVCMMLHKVRSQLLALCNVYIVVTVSITGLKP